MKNKTIKVHPPNNTKERSRCDNLSRRYVSEVPATPVTLRWTTPVQGLKTKSNHIVECIGTERDEQNTWIRKRFLKERET